MNCSIPLPFGLMETTEMGKEALSSLVDDAHVLSSVESPLLTDNSQVIGMNGIVIPSNIVDDNVSGNADVCRDISESSVVSLSNIDSITLHKMATFPAVAGNKSRSCMNLMGQPITADLQTQTISSAEKLTIFDYFSSYIRQVCLIGLVFKIFTKNILVISNLPISNHLITFRWSCILCKLSRIKIAICLVN